MVSFVSDALPSILSGAIVLVAMFTFRSAKRLEDATRRMEDRDLASRRQAARMAAVYFRALVYAIDVMCVPAWGSGWSAELTALPPCTLRQELADRLPDIIQTASGTNWPPATSTQQKTRITDLRNHFQGWYDDMMSQIDQWDGYAR